MYCALGPVQLFREDTDNWLVKPVGEFARALRDVGTAADLQAKLPVGENGSLSKAAQKINYLFSTANAGAGACLAYAVNKRVLFSRMSAGPSGTDTFKLPPADANKCGAQETGRRSWLR